MEFIISKSELNKCLQHIKYVIVNNNILPMLKNFFFEFKEKKLFISGSDIETTITININIENIIEKKFCIPANILTKIIKTLPNVNINFFIKENLLEIRSTQGTYKISIINPNNFSKINNNIFNIIQSDNNIIISNNTLIKVIDSTLFATGNDDIRPVMNGVFFSSNPEGSVFVATDSHKLVKFFIKNICTKNIFNCILPKKTLYILKNIISIKKEFILKILYNESNVQFLFDNKNINCRLINGKYPNYQSVIPTIINHELIVNRLMLLDIIKRISIFSNIKTRKIYFSIISNKIKIYAQDLESSNEAYEYLKCEFNGNNIQIGFDYKILIEVISHLNTEYILLKICNSNKPIIFNPIYNTSFNDKITMLVMPMAIN